MAIPLRSAATFEGRRMAGARALWRANGMTEEQIGRIFGGGDSLLVYVEAPTAEDLVERERPLGQAVGQ